MLRYVALAAVGAVATAAVALRARWSVALARLLRWQAVHTERNSRIVAIVLVAACAAAALWLALLRGSSEKEIAELARALAEAEIVDLDDVPEGSAGAQRLAALQASLDADDLYDLAAPWLRELEPDADVAARTQASYRLWLCAWLLRRMGDSRGDDLALALWRQGDFNRPAIKDGLRTGAQLAAALDDPDARERTAAARILGETAYRAAAAPLAAALSDSDPKVREYAAVALGRVGDAARAPTLEKLLSDPEREVRAAAAEALGRVGTASSVKPLEALYLREDDWQVRLEVVRTLGKIGDPAAGATLIGALSDRHEKVRQAAVVALKRIGPALAPALRETIDKTANPWVRDAAREVLAAVGTSKPKPAPAPAPASAPTPTPTAAPDAAAPRAPDAPAGGGAP
jgi:hypothetical protein